MIPETERLRREQYLEKPLPADAEAERCTLGGVILDQNLIFQLVATLKADDYYSPMYRNIIKAMFALAERGENVNPINIGNELKKTMSLDSLGGISAITNLTYGLPHFDDLMDFISIIKDKSLLRRLIKFFNMFTEMALSEEYTAKEILDRIEREIFTLRNSLEENINEYMLAGEISAERIKEIQMMKKEGRTTGLSTNLTDCDFMTSGLKKTDLIIDAGRPSMGKSSLMLDDVNGIHDKLNEAVSVIFTGEMSKELCADRLLCQRARISLQRFLNGALSHDEWKRAGEAKAQMREYKIVIIDETRITPLRMRYHINRIADKYGRIDSAHGDYAELFEADKQYEANRHRLGAIALGCKEIAKDYNIPFKLLCQLSRAPEKRNPPKPIMSDLAESGDFEKHADVVRGIYRKEYYFPNCDEKGTAEILYLKNRNGATGTVKVAWQGFSTHFANLSEE